MNVGKIMARKEMEGKLLNQYKYLQKLLNDMPDARCQMPDARCQMPDTRFKMPDTRFKMPDTRFKMPDARYKKNTKSRRKFRNGRSHYFKKLEKENFNLPDDNSVVS